MTLLTNILSIALAYLALALWLAHLSRAIGQKNRTLAALLCVLPILLLPAIVLPILYEILLAIGVFAIARWMTPGSPLVPPVETRLCALHLILVATSSLFLVPLFWMVLTSLKEESQVSRFPPEFIPTQQVKIAIQGRDLPLVTLEWQGRTVQAGVEEKRADNKSLVRLADRPSVTIVVSDSNIHEVRHFSPLWRNYPDALKFLPPESRYGLANLQNTLEIAIFSVIGTLLSSSLVAYAFARMRWPGRDWLFGVVLATMMLPDAVTMMPRFLIFQRLGWFDTLYPLWVPAFFGSAFNIFLLRQFFMSIPQELEDAAKIDGCSYLGTYWRVMLPMIRPAMITVAIMAFIGAWKDFIGPLIYISSPEKMPVSYVLQLFNSAHGDQPGMLMAATTLVIVPIVILFFFAQRYFIEGISLTGMGGR